MSQKSFNSEAEIAVILQEVSRTKKHIASMTTQFFENNLKFKTVFTDEQKTFLNDKMLELIQVEQQIKVQQKATLALQNEAFQIVRKQENFENKRIEEFIESVNLNEMLSQKLEMLKQEAACNQNDDECYRTMLNIIKDDNIQNNLNEGVEMVDTGKFNFPVDPFTRRDIVIPLRNKNCKHYYEKEQFLKVFESLPRNGVIKCPMTGCANKKVFINDVEEDIRMKIQIESERAKIANGE